MAHVYFITMLCPGISGDGPSVMLYLKKEGIALLAALPFITPRNTSTAQYNIQASENLGSEVQLFSILITIMTLYLPSYAVEVRAAEKEAARRQFDRPSAPYLFGLAE